MSIKRNRSCIVILLAAVLLVLTAGWLFIKPYIDYAITTDAIETFQYKGHDMIRYEYKGSYSICHDPECRKCYRMFD